MNPYNIVMLAGDGVGPEVTAAARLILDVVAEEFGREFAFHRALIGGAAIDKTGDPLPKETLEVCQSADAIFLGAVGGPKWDGGARRPEEGLLGLRKALGLFANLRPVQVVPGTGDNSPFKPEITRGVDMLIVRELTGGAYFGEKTRTDVQATDLCVYSVEEIERVTRVAFRAAEGRRKHVTSVDKANVMETSRLWRDTVNRIHKAEFPHVALEHMLVDSAAMKLIQKPRAFDVILTENMFGDILSDEASMLAGSIGLLGSASLGVGSPSLFEPIHGSAPDIAGRNVANPTGAVMSVAMMLHYGLGLEAEAEAVESSVNSVLTSGRKTVDLGGHETCSQFAREVADAIRRMRWASTHSQLMHWA